MIEVLRRECKLERKKVAGGWREIDGKEFYNLCCQRSVINEVI
jgi:hypothetical protein